MDAYRRTFGWITSVPSFLFLFFVALYARPAQAAGLLLAQAQDYEPPAYLAWIPEGVRDLVSVHVFEVGGRVIVAMVLFIIGWIIAKFISYGVYSLLSRTTFDNVIANRLGINTLMPDSDKDGKRGNEDGAIERFTAKVVFWICMLLVVVGVLQFVGLSQVAGPLERLVDTIVQALPRIGKAVLILVIAYFAGRILKAVIGNGLNMLDVDRRFAALAEDDQPPKQTFAETAGNIVFWLLIVVGLAGAFQALDIEPISAPLRNALDQLVGYVPDLAVAALIIFAGWILSKLLRTIVRNLLSSLGFDNLMKRWGLAKFAGELTPSDLMGVVVMAFVMIQAVIAGLNQVGMTTLSQPLTNMVDQFWQMLPALAISVVIIAAGVFIGKLLRAVVTTALRNFGFDGLMARVGFGKMVDREEGTNEFSELVGYAVQVVVVLLAIAQALDNLELSTWAVHVNTLLTYLLENVLIALAVVMVGFVLGQYVRDLVVARQGDNETGRWIGEFARYAVLVFAFTMAVRQLDVAEDFVLMSFGLLFGALCLALGLAFGLGGKDVANEVIKRRYNQARTKLNQGPKSPNTPGTPPTTPPTTPPGGGFGA